MLLVPNKKLTLLLLLLLVLIMPEQPLKLPKA